MDTPVATMGQADDVEPPEDATDPPHWTHVLAAPTPQSEIRQRGVWKNGQPVLNQDGSPYTLDYITARFVQDRLDMAVGPANWQTTFESLPSGAVRCGIGIREPDPDGDYRDWVWKFDVGTPSTIEGEKGAHSDALKRAAVSWGIARDLYEERDDKPTLDQAQQVNSVRMDQPVMPRGATVQQQVSQQQPPQVQSAQPVGTYVESGAPAWMCPMHQDVKIVPAGISRKTGRAYNAFYACPVAGCDQKGPSA